MKNTFKKITASIMAVASLATCITGISASAADASASFTPSATASLSVTSTFVSPSTKCSYICSTITAKVTSTEGGTLSEPVSFSGYGTTSVSGTCYGTGITKAKSHHYVKVEKTGSTGEKDLTVTR